MEQTQATQVVRARQVLHALAEQLLAGPQHRTTGEIALAVTDGGFATTASPGGGLERLEVRAGGVHAEPGGREVPLGRPVRSLAAVLGVRPGIPVNLYLEHAELGPDDDLGADPAALSVVLGALSDGAAALRALAPDETPVLWPEHFDVGLSVDEVNYGVSPGDAGHDLPYAYVGPWTPRTGDFWNEPFGASRPLTQLAGVDGILAFFLEGRELAAGT
ncbi:hypothetical protein ACIB24_09590 [Spongisporangium articulatum]|uniref:Uncharacterized protein n=1 Tax=Spongisporangium articulatum TaxID=3362603 RepID=A0ABW8ANX3_9ACTN